MPPITSVGVDRIRVKTGTDADVLTNFGADWPAIVGPVARSAALIANAVRTEDIDVSQLPNSALAIIRVSWVAIKTSGPGGATLAQNGVVLALRDKLGALGVLPDGFSLNAAGLSVDPLVGLSNITAPDANTVRLSITNGNNSTAWRFQYVLSIVEAGAPVDPL